MDSQDWAKYIEATDGLSKPWLLVQWRLQLLKERRSEMDPEAFQAALEELHQDLMNLGEWWVGQEEEVFGLGNDYRGDR
ncbi:hypothetical protein [Pseudanabaena sp. FACHB-2040]|uniref:hypothetical protein n=1 Tax=Pseudanabaena sp. FACHB-2040 TaxID=2692859 RepID=UPI001682CDCE|nr:hypothetical protein [Pseudanabaena sp. FACHB-2040]MBD0267576.1 hypothetical protein [Cyanobacteria bacterium Co-bin8]MBD2260137.1 hypothetical protein [Pseudanabaena sp. FACHB-2040]